MHKYLAFDLGASSGRGIIGTIQNNKLELKEMHRFYNGMTNVLGTDKWDIYRLYDEIKKGLVSCVSQDQIPDSIGIDTWGVDYGLLDEQGNLLDIPFAYRDHRTDNAIAEFLQKISREDLYSLTGIQFMQFNTLFQLHAAQRDNLPVMKLAKDLLFMPDMLNYFLSGIKKTEFSFATTSQLYNPRNGNWEPQLFDLLNLDMGIMQDIVDSGSILGPLSGQILKDTGMPRVNIINVASHDTGSAIASVPAEDQDFAYISSGTWSLMGMELNKPVLTREACDWNFTNEGGVNRTIRFLKNIMGLWLIQECRKEWMKSGEEYSFSELVDLAGKAEAFKSIINPDDSSFYNPDNMPDAIRNFCRNNNESAPDSPGEFARSIFEGLALRYKNTVDGLEKVTGKTISRIHIIGGGCQNELLCQYAANATNKQVVAGPVEATAIGNLMVQAMASGEVSSLGEARSVIKNSFQPKEYNPENVSQWQDAYGKFYDKYVKS